MYIYTHICICVWFFFSQKPISCSQIRNCLNEKPLNVKKILYSMIQLLALHQLEVVMRKIAEFIKMENVNEYPPVWTERSNLAWPRKVHESIFIIRRFETSAEAEWQLPDLLTSKILFWVEGSVWSP